MDKEEALNHLRQGHSLIWNDYRKKNPNWRPDLEGEDLSEISFVPEGKRPFDMRNAILVGCKLPALDKLLAHAALGRSSQKGGLRTTYLLREDLTSDSGAMNEILASLMKKSQAGLLSAEGNIADTLAATDLHNSENLDSRQRVDRLKELTAGHLSGILIDQTTSIVDGSDIELLVQLGARFATQEELKRERAEVPRKVFISYAWADEDKVQAMEQWLRRKGLSTTLDKRDFFAGEEIKEEIVRGMRDADAILLFHSKLTANKPWIEFERKLARRLRSKGTQEQKPPPQTIYVVLDDTPLPDIEKGRIAIVAQGLTFGDLCQKIYDSVLHIPKTSSDIDLSKWEDLVFGADGRLERKPQDSGADESSSSSA